MAKYTNEEVVFGTNCALPTDTYVLRMSMERKKSSAGNPMVVTSLEIVEPTSVEVLGKKYATGGQKTSPIFTVLDPSMGFMAQMIEGLRRADLDPKVVQDLAEGEIFSDEPEDLAKYNNKCLRMTVDSQPRKAMRRPTPEEKAAGIKSEPLKNPDGSEVVLGYQLSTDWTRVVGPALKDDGTPY